MMKLKRLVSLLTAIIVVSVSAISATAAVPDDWEDNVRWDISYGYIRDVAAGVKTNELRYHAYFRYPAYNNLSNVLLYNSEGSQKSGQTLVATGDLLSCVTGKASILRVSVLGDVDGDAKVDIADVTRLRQLIMNGTGEVRPHNPYENAGDVDKDGRLTVADVTALRAMIL